MTTGLAGQQQLRSARRGGPGRAAWPSTAPSGGLTLRCGNLIATPLASDGPRAAAWRGGCRCHRWPLCHDRRDLTGPGRLYLILAGQSGCVLTLRGIIRAFARLPAVTPIRCRRSATPVPGAWKRNDVRAGARRSPVGALLWLRPITSTLTCPAAFRPAACAGSRCFSLAGLTRPAAFTLLILVPLSGCPVRLRRVARPGQDGRWQEGRERGRRAAAPRHRRTAQCRCTAGSTLARDD
jgi:hypothetical protein